VVQLRPYQQEAVDAIMSWVRKSTEPCLIEAATGGGKSLLVADIARQVHKSSGKRVLCLAPSAELVVQNREKYILTGNPASTFSASAGSVSLRHPVVFGSPLTVKNKINRFGADFAMVILDEAHGLTPTIKTIIERIREKNPNLRIVGMTATPYRLGEGYIYKIGTDDKPMPEHTVREPYFTKLVYQIGARMLIENGYLTPPVMGRLGAGGYETRSMALNTRGQFDKEDIDRAFHGHGRKTAAIIADIVAQSRNRNGVMIFAATVQHAQECMASLPPSLSAIVTGSTPAEERRRMLARFKAQELKYLVNVAVLTTGFDAPHVDVVALLRATESVGLLQQIIGRGLRLHDGKDDCLILDYAENIDRHCPDGDIFDPQIKAGRIGGETVTLNAVCEQCGTENEFKARPNEDGFDVDVNGYFTDLDGSRIETEHGAMPAHYGRKCQGLHRQPGGSYAQCTYRWTFKECPHCDAENDIAARYCVECRGEIVDPGEKLRIEFKALKKDPTRRQTDEVLDWVITENVSQSGNETWRIDWTTPYRSFSTWVMKKPRNENALRDKEKLIWGTQNMTVMPHSITYAKDPNTKFYRISDYNREPDREPE
jgi:DNA repair protein RadD